MAERNVESAKYPITQPKPQTKCPAKNIGEPVLPKRREASIRLLWMMSRIIAPEIRKGVVSYHLTKAKAETNSTRKPWHFAVDLG